MTNLSDKPVCGDIRLCQDGKVGFPGASHSLMVTDYGCQHRGMKKNEQNPSNKINRIQVGYCGYEETL